MITGGGKWVEIKISGRSTLPAPSYDSREKFWRCVESGEPSPVRLPCSPWLAATKLGVLVVAGSQATARRYTVKADALWLGSGTTQLPKPRNKLKNIGFVLLKRGNTRYACIYSNINYEMRIAWSRTFQA